ncbi:hypothetical protein PABG_02608 [Paracoccidioides brasiliensis Pb03]|nr:hypothetical protein PABG_02608 [Paracoccidioides brasiliensis Pb03]
MAARKRNEYLDIESSEGEGSEGGYDSEAVQEAKGKGRNTTLGTVMGRERKRRKVFEDADSGEGEDGVGDGDNEAAAMGDAETFVKRSDEGEGGADEDENEEKTRRKDISTTTAAAAAAAAATATATTKPKSLKSRKDKTGVIYFSSLPPYLKPSALKSLLTQRGFSPITKIFLSPHTPRPSTSKRPTTNRRRTYTDGWVEFASKRTAKICAQTLNATIVGGKKGGWYHDDVWTMKYLRGFKWGDLMEQVQRERSEREARRRIEDARARREERVFVDGVERGRVVEGIRRKRVEKGREKGKQGVDGDGDGDGSGMAGIDVRRVFRQNEVRAGGKDGEKALDADVKRVLGKIF